MVRLEPARDSAEIGPDPRLGFAAIVSFDMRLSRLLLAIGTVLSMSTPAWADLTAFIGTASAPTNRTTRGFAIGAPCAAEEQHQ